MNLSDIPAKFKRAFASGAGTGVRTVPDGTSSSGADGSASFFNGFPPVTMKPISAGGIPPAGQDMNGILQATTAWLLYFQAGGTVAYDSNFAQAVGGYPMGAVLQSTSPGRLWRNTTDGNTSDPDSAQATGWTAASVEASLSNPGWRRTPTGSGQVMLEQWTRDLTASTDGTGRALITFNFPLPFPTGVLGYSYAPDQEAGTDVPQMTLLAQKPSLVSQTLIIHAPTLTTGQLVAASGMVWGY